jgi:alkylhydroperoxidase family enzyme
MTANDLFAAASNLMKSWMGVSNTVAASLEPGLVELGNIHASRINGCGNCISNFQ